MSYEIKLENLCFGYDGNSIIKNLSLEFPKSHFTSIIGPNGSGKSTLLRLISGALKPDKGWICIDNADISKLNKKEAAKIMSVVPQNTALEFDYRVMDVVLMGRYPYISRLKGETPEDRDIAAKNMEYTNTYHLRNRSFNQLSGGERQRVILAQALTQQPKILLLDEPISHLDLQHQIEIMTLIKKLSMDNELTVVAVLHDMNMAAAYSDNIVMLKNGEIYCQGTPVEAFTPDNIRDVFNIDVDVEVSALTNRPYIYTISKKKIKKNNVKVHVICGGGSGSEIISNLYNSGFEVSTGVLSIGDLDWKISKEFDLRLSEDIPFSRISDDAYATNKVLASEADYIVLTDLYIGKANVRNLEVLMEKELQNKPIIILGDDSFMQRDITAGKAEAFYENIKKREASIAASKEEMYSILNKAGEAVE